MRFTWGQFKFEFLSSFWNYREKKKIVKQYNISGHVREFYALNLAG